MNKRILKRLLVLFAVAVLCIYLVASRGIPLGLDLRGGTQIVLHVLTDDVLKAHTEATLETIRRDVMPRIGRPARVTSDDPGEIRVAGLAPSALNGQVPAWDATPDSEQAIPATTLRMRPAETRMLREEATIQTMQVIENRLNTNGLSEITIQRYGEPESYEMQIQIPGGFDPERIRQLIGTTGLLEFRIVEHGPFKSTEAAAAVYQGKVPSDMEILPYQEDDAETMFYIIQRSTSVAGRHLRTVTSSMDRAGRPAVAFTLNQDGAERFGKVTGDNIDRQLAIVLDGIVQSTAIIEAKIESSGIIQGGSHGFTAEQVRDLIVVLRSGALPARTRTTAEQVIGPSLGEDSIRSGIAASSIAMAAVSATVVAYYRKAGINAVVAMLFNLLILLGVMAYFQAPLTLPGIAGIVLTIGMGIDSNVLVFERIREELRAGKATAAAIAAGFHRVFRTLIDTHLAAMISAAILFMFSSGPVRGFAVSLAIGLVSNLFTSIFVSRTLFAAQRIKEPMSI